MKALEEAIQSKDFISVNDLLSTNFQNDIENCRRVLACVNNAEELCSVFYGCGEDIIEFFRKRQDFMLHLAIAEDMDMKIIEAILNLDKDCINRIDINDMTPLMTAVSENGEVGLIKFLLENGADVNVYNSLGESPLHFVQTSEVVNLLIEKGANINCADEEGITPIMSAIKSIRDGEVILEFIKNGADLEFRNHVGHTSLHLALYFKCDEGVIIEICNKTPNYNVKDSEGLTPLCCAINDSGLTMHRLFCDGKKMPYPQYFIHELINKGFVINTDVFMYALQYCDNVELIESLTKYVDIKCVDNDGNSVLHHVRDARVVNILARRGAPINNKNNKGLTPLEYALVKNESMKTKESLLFWGSDIRLVDFLVDFDKLNQIGMSCELFNLLSFYGLSVSFKNSSVERYLSYIFDEIVNHQAVSPDICILRHMYLSNENVTIPEKFRTNVELNNLIEKYNVELNKMKQEIFTDHVTYHNFCIKKYRSIKSPFVGKEFTHYDRVKIICLFPSFYDEIIIKIKINIRINKRKELLRKFDKVCFSIRRDKDNISNKNYDSSCEYIVLDYDSMYILASFMNDREINCVLTAAMDGGA